MVIWIVLAAVAIFAAMGILARAKVTNLHRQREYQSDFFDAAEVLVHSDEVPNSVAKLVLTMGRVMRMPKAPWLLLRFLLEGDVRESVRSQRYRESEPIRDAMGMSEDLQWQFQKAVAACALALTHRSVLIGWLIRRVAFYRVGKQEATKRYDGGEDAAPPIVTLSMRLVT